MRQIIYQNIFVFFLYILFYWLQKLTFFQIQTSFQNSTVALGAASLVFLPHGVRVLSYTFFGPKIFYGLFLAHFISGLSISSSYLDMFLLALFSSLCALLAIKIYTGNFYLKNIKIFNFKFIVYVSFIAALINSFSNNTYKLIVGGENFNEIYSSQMIQFIIGDVIGTIVLFYLFLLSKKVITGSFN
jgi:hypothetical protein